MPLLQFFLTHSLSLTLSLSLSLLKGVSSVKILDSSTFWSQERERRLVTALGIISESELNKITIRCREIWILFSCKPIVISRYTNSEKRDLRKEAVTRITSNCPGINLSSSPASLLSLFSRLSSLSLLPPFFSLSLSHSLYVYHQDFCLAKIGLPSGEWSLRFLQKDSLRIFFESLKDRWGRERMKRNIKGEEGDRNGRIFSSPLILCEVINVYYSLSNNTSFLILCKITWYFISFLGVLFPSSSSQLDGWCEGRETLGWALSLTMIHTVTSDR